VKLFENRVLRSMFGSKSDDIRRYWMELHSEERNDVCSLPNITQVIK
jgi:hypothetical protein